MKDVLDYHSRGGRDEERQSRDEVANFFLLILISEGDQFCLQTDGTMNGE
jgi:hypothetical protein